MTDTSDPAKQDAFLEGKALSFWQKFTFSLGNIGVNLAPGIVVSWVVFYYMGRENPDGTKMVLVSATAIAAMNMLGRIVDSIADPLVGYYSDKWQTRWGRRIPWVVIGTPLLALFATMVWFPPQDHAGWLNIVWLGVAMSGLWFFYTVVVAPYLALIPEITPYKNERVVLSTYMSYMVVVSLLVSTIGAGQIFEAFKDGLSIGPIHMTNGYQVGGLLFALISVVCFYASVAFIKEKPSDQIKPVPFKFMEAAVQCSRNPGFWPYIIAVSMLRLGIDVLIMMIPFMVMTLMGYGEAIAGGLQGVIVLGAALLFPLVAHLANVYGKKKIMSIGLIGFVPTLVLLVFTYHFPFVGYGISFVAGLFGASMDMSAIMLAHCIGLFVLGMFPVAVVLVLPIPIYADIMDHDEERTGYRREAMYNGMEGLITKFAAGLSGVSVPLLLKYFGDSKELPWGILSAGPLCGICFIVGWIAFKRHPFKR